MNLFSMIGLLWESGDYIAAFWATCGLLVLPVWALAAFWEGWRK